MNPYPNTPATTMMVSIIIAKPNQYNITNPIYLPNPYNIPVTNPNSNTTVTHSTVNIIVTKIMLNSCNKYQYIFNYF